MLITVIATGAIMVVPVLAKPPHLRLSADHRLLVICQQ